MVVASPLLSSRWWWPRHQRCWWGGAGTALDEFIHAVHALIEFIYRAQDPVHTDSSITAMEQALAEFHARKQSILNLRVQRGGKGPIGHFKIPKLELMMSFTQQTKVNGPLIQYTADVPERLLITHCKTTFQHTSRNTRTYVDQVVEILNHCNGPTFYLI